MTAARESVALTVETLTQGYSALFPRAMRAAQIACLEHARLRHEDGWPTVKSCLTFAELYGVSPAELAAFFGWLGYGEGGRTIWVDALRGPVSSHLARQRMTPEQARAFGFQCAAADAFRAEGTA